MKKSDLYKYLTLYKDLYGDNIYLTSQAKSSFFDCSILINHTITNDIYLSDRSNKLNSYLNIIKNYIDSSLGEAQNNIVLGMGNSNADVVFVEESSLKLDDLKDFSFTGKTGKLLDRILSSIRLSRKDIFILNVLKFGLSSSSDSLKVDTKKCKNYLKEQLKIINPKIIIALGEIPVMTILKTKKKIKNMENQILSYEGIDLLNTYHPASLLRNPNLKKSAWEDFKLIRDKYINV